MKPTKSVKRAILLVAGTGSRLHPLTQSTPKCLLEVSGEPLVVRFLKQLKQCNIEIAYLITGFYSEKIIETLNALPDLPELNFVFNQEYNTLGNAYSVKLGLNAILENSVLDENEAILVADGDVLLKDDTIFTELIKHPAANLFAVEPRSDLGHEEMKVIVDSKTNGVLALDKKLEPNQCYGESMGVQLLSPASAQGYLNEISNISKEMLKSLYYENIIAMNTNRLNQFRILEIPQGAFIEIDTIDDLEKARELAITWNHQ